MTAVLNFYKKVKLSLKILIFLAFTLFYISPNNLLYAQFGQNKVQYKVFDWYFIQSKHFDIYFNKGGDYIAQFTAVAAESSLTSIENNINYKIRTRIPIIVFNSHNEFQQNNIIDEYLPEGVGGVTELFKNRITVPFEGDYLTFRRVIHHEILHAYMNDMYYGGSLQNIITQNIRLQFPLWFNEGMAEYQSLNGMDKNNDMFIRDAVIYDYLPEVDYLGGYLAYRGGQSFFSWLAEEYGKDKIGDLMQQIKAVGDVDVGFEDVYKLRIEDLSEKWLKYLKQTYWPDISLRDEITDFANRVTNHRKDGGFYNTAPALSPNGEQIAYISNRDDYFDVFIADAQTGEIIKKVIEGNRTADFEELHLLAPGLCWSPNGKKIAISVKSGNKDAIYIVDVESEDEKVLPIKFDGIFSVKWNPKKNTLVFVGTTSKQSDIWTYDLKTKKLESITSDIFSDSDPSWSSDGKKIYFTSDRVNFDELNNNAEEFDISKYDYSEKDIYVYDLELRTLSKFAGKKNSNESNVVSSPDGKKVLYISDRNGIKNIWMRDLESGNEKPITNSIDPIELMSLSADGNRLAFTALNKGGYDIFYLDNPFDIDLKIKELPNTKFVEKLLQSQENSQKDSVSITKKDTPANFEFQKEKEVFYNFSKPDSSVVNTNGDTNKIYGDDINLVLNPEDDTLKSTASKVKLKEKSKFRLTDNVNEDGSLRIHKYKIKFSPDIIYSNVNYSSFYGVQGIAQMAFSDILGNHRIFILTSLVLDLKNSDYAFAYYYLPKRIDYGFEAYHSARFLLFNTLSNNVRVQNLFRYRTYGANLSASYPMNKFNRLDGVLSYSSILKENLDNPNEPSQTLRYILPLVSFVHDNTLFGYTAPIRGKRFNLTLLGTPKIGRQGVSFLSAVGDYRTYIKLIEDYNFVWRLSGGVSVGKNPQRFFIGGTSNWINYEVQNNILPIEEISDFAFSTPVLPLRGYNYNTRSGSKFVLMNTELRFPLFKYLVLGPLPLAFQNIQGVMFADIGTAWTNNNSLQFFTKQDGKIKTKDLLIGLGIGARVFLLYFPLKFDVAWSYDLNKFSPPKYYISLGADF